jgi:hypothetical protein
LGRIVSQPVLVFRQNRHESLRERAFGKQTTQQVWDFESDEKCVGEQSRTEYAGNEGIAHESENTREQGHAAYRSEGFEKVHGQNLLCVHCAGRAGAPQLRWRGCKTSLICRGVVPYNRGLW